MRSLKQQVQARRFRTTLTITSARGAPASSWWTESLSRAAFDARAAFEAERMKMSSFGQFKAEKGEPPA